MSGLYRFAPDHRALRRVVTVCAPRTRKTQRSPALPRLLAAHS